MRVVNSVNVGGVTYVQYEFDKGEVTEKDRREALYYWFDAREKDWSFDDALDLRTVGARRDRIREIEADIKDSEREIRDLVAEIRIIDRLSAATKVNVVR